MLFLQLARLVLLLLLTTGSACAGERFPRPEFRETTYAEPSTFHPPARDPLFSILDVAALALALVAAAWLVHRRRSRRGLIILTLLSLAYFGFYRKGCVCSVGSIQNVAESLAEPSIGLPLTILLFFLLPLLAALWAGRVFCSGVCPLGAVQEILTLYPLRIPRGVDRALRFLPHVVLAGSLLFAACGAGYWICEHDRVVPLFRLSGPKEALLASGGALLVCLVIARPFCRFGCPYALLLAACSRLAAWRVSVTPGECIDCRLCESACPIDAIEWPEAAEAGAAVNARRTTLLLLLLTPLLIGAGAGIGYALRGAVEARQPELAMLRAVLIPAERRSAVERDLADGFRLSGLSESALRDRGAALQRRIAWGGALAGAYLGLVAGVQLLSTSRRPRRKEHAPAARHCVACGRCFASCPVHRNPSSHLRLMLERSC